MPIFDRKPVDEKWEEAKRIVLNDKGTLDGNHPLVIQIYEDIKKSDMDKAASFSPYFLAGVELGLSKSSARRKDMTLITYVDPSSIDSVKEHGLMSSKALIENRNVLELAASARGRDADAWSNEISKK